MGSIKGDYYLLKKDSAWWNLLVRNITYIGDLRLQASEDINGAKIRQTKKQKGITFWLRYSLTFRDAFGPNHKHVLLELSVSQLVFLEPPSAHGLIYVGPQILFGVTYIQYFHSWENHCFTTSVFFIFYWRLTTNYFVLIISVLLQRSMSLGRPSQLSLLYLPICTDGNIWCDTISIFISA
jgi:hypothetical protein